jgi:U4/U6.U5 tri-snRNP-associated protein 1
LRPICDPIPFTPTERESAAAAAESKVAFLHETAAQGGLAAALARAKQRGQLQAAPKLVGRANDSKGMKIVEKMVEVGQAPPQRRSKVDADYDFSNVELSYRNDRGELMTQREAFRHISHYMHGNFPSQNKLEKEHRKRQIEVHTREQMDGF